MTKAIRLILVISILTVSLSLLAWSMWPSAHETRIVAVPPAELVLPTSSP